jgi:hypothetical protein
MDENSPERVHIPHVRRARTAALLQPERPVCVAKAQDRALAGAMSMRQNDFGGLSRASRIAARITAGCVTAVVRNVLCCKALCVRDASHPATRSISSTID